EHLRVAVRMQGEAEPQPTIHPKRDVLMLSHQRRQGGQSYAQGLGRVLAAVARAADDDRVTGMRRGGGEVLRQTGQATLRTCAAWKEQQQHSSPRSPRMRQAMTHAPGSAGVYKRIDP